MKPFPEQELNALKRDLEELLEIARTSLVETHECKTLQRTETTEEPGKAQKTTPEEPLEKKSENPYIFQESRYNWPIRPVYTRQEYRTAPLEEKKDIDKEMVRLYQNSLLTVEEIACYLKWRYNVNIRPSTISKKARKILEVKGREKFLSREIALNTLEIALNTLLKIDSFK